MAPTAEQAPMRSQQRRVCAHRESLENLYSEAEVIRLERRDATAERPSTMSSTSPGRVHFGLVCLLFFLSGCTALVYQIVWVRLLSLSFGASTYALAAVLIAYMGGMCAGALAVARWIDRSQHPLHWYAGLELLVGLYALALPTLLDGLSAGYVLVYQQWAPGFYVLSIVRLIASALVLLVPTMAMGATLPILCAALAGTPGDISQRTAMLYSVNTLGGAFGCLLTGFWLLPRLGIAGATYAAVAMNAAVALATLLAAQGRSLVTRAAPAGAGCDKPALRPVGPPPSPLTVAAVYVVTALSGFTAIAYETLWTRALTLVVGTTVYAFSTLLAAFLCGIVLGSMLYARLRFSRPALQLAAVQGLIGIFMLGGLPYLDQLPFVFLRLLAWSGQDWASLQVLRFGLLFGVLLIPGTLFGVSFPLAIGIATCGQSAVGRCVGMLYAVNTVGAIVGAAVGAFGLIPLVGIQGGILIVATINLLAAALLLVVTSEAPAARKLSWGGAGASVVVAALVLLRPWNLAYVNSGVYVYGPDYEKVADVRGVLNAYTTQFYREGPTATVAVVRSPTGTLSLAIDGKTDASTGNNADMSTQILLSHLPAMFVDRPEQALLVGLGSGVSLGSLLRHPVGAVDAVEISEAVVEASAYFADYNGDALHDPRVRLIVADARDHLRRTTHRYDLIVSQPSNPWISGVANLFTREYYRMVAAHLTERGVACQWVPSYQMSRDMLAVIFKTFSAEFPHVTVWSSTAVGDLFLIGSREPLQVGYSALLERLARPEVSADLARIGLTGPALLARTFKFGAADIARFVDSAGQPVPLNTDMNPVVEFACPRYVLARRVARDFRREVDLSGDAASLMELIEFQEDGERSAFTRIADESTSGS